jgi:hypothetical protein
MVSFPPVVQISTLGEDEAEFTLTSKGVNNNVMNSPANLPRRRRHPAKKITSTAIAKVVRNSQISRKRVLDEYQNQLVVRPAIPISNPFSALHIA